VTNNSKDLIAIRTEITQKLLGVAKYYACLSSSLGVRLSIKCLCYLEKADSTHYHVVVENIGRWWLWGSSLLLVFTDVNSNLCRSSTGLIYYLHTSNMKKFC